jgi:ATP synthase protein I
VSTPSDKEKLELLSERLKHAQGHDKATQKPPSGRNSGLTVAAELIAALLVGVFIGVMLDKWLGTKPWLMLLFIFIGGAAGFFNIYRSAMRVNNWAENAPPVDQNDVSENK